MATALASLRIVLVEPAGALNVGAVARIMKNMGLHHLVLVNARCDPLSADARQMAVHAIDVLEAAEQVTSVSDALRGCQRAIATTGQEHTTLNITLEHPRSALPWLLKPSKGGNTASALIFGREDRGLTNEELNLAQRFVQIPSSSVYRSLNLAQAVAICCYELYTWAAASGEQGEQTAEAQRRGGEEKMQAGEAGGAAPGLAELALREELERYYQHLEGLLLTIGYLYPHTASSRMKKLRRLFNRAYPSGTEVAMLQGIVSQVEWALGRIKGADEEGEMRGEG